MAAKAATLTLESSAAQEADVNDALPYIDTISAEESRQANELINEEVTLAPCQHGCNSNTAVYKQRLRHLYLQLKHRTKKPSDYLASFPPLPKSRLQVAALALIDRASS